MADIFAHNKMTDKNKVDFILDKGTHLEYASYRRFIVALLSEWELTPKLLERKESIKMHRLILACLRHHGKAISQSSNGCKATIFLVLKYYIIFCKT